MKYHGGQPLQELKTPNLNALKKGLDNLEKHIENTEIFHIPVVVAINRFVTDTEEEINAIIDFCDVMGIESSICEGWEKGGEGMIDAAEKVVELADNFSGDCHAAYDWRASVKEKIENVATRIYGANQVEYLPKAKQNLKKIARLGLEKTPICIAKTQNSLSDDPKWLGRPRDFTITIREIEIAAGAGFVIPITGNMLRMPGLPAAPAAEGIDINNGGTITGLS